MMTFIFYQSLQMITVHAWAAVNFQGSFAATARLDLSSFFCIFFFFLN